ncbi:7-carboxy-7-deazaguanine synthase [Candidatus Tiddalikarchaeum anstoanum]|nr:7-carboxy-7-deazaguanine synthase [Candidatus Tiddalikarchaeum anstoanum]
MKEALFYLKKDNEMVQCELCCQHCTINKGKFGFCNARVNVDGVLISDVYGRITALNIDPIEKKPLYHFYPGSSAYSIGTNGCNFHCIFCQNYEISQSKSDSSIANIMTPSQVVKDAVDNDCQIIAYTYNEPTVNYEFALETAKLAVKKGLKNIFVTNGYIEKEPLQKISKYISAATIDLKGFNKKIYSEVIHADLDKVLETIKIYNKLRIHIELTMLLIPRYSDNLEEVKLFSKWIINNLSADVPVHFLRFFPYYKLQAPITPEETISKAVGIARKEGLKYVYGGNIFKKEFVNTICPKCGNLLIDRFSSNPKLIGLVHGACNKCKEKISLLY